MDRLGLMTRAWLLKEQGDMAAAARLWREQTENAGAADLLEQGAFCLRHGWPGEARAALLCALRLGADNGYLRRLLAQAAAAQENWQSAALHWRAALAPGTQAVAGAAQGLLPSTLNASAEAALAGLARALLEQGDFLAASATLDRLAASESGRRQALALRVMLAERQQDESAAHAARRAYQEAFPQEAARASAWLRPRSADAAITPDALLQAKDEQTAHWLMHQLEPGLPRSDYLQLARQAADRMPDAAGLQERHIRLLADDLTGDAMLQELQARAAAFCERFPCHPQGWQLAALAAVAGNDQAAVARLIETQAARLGAHPGLDSLRVWLAASQGQHKQAAIAARRLHRRFHFHEDGRGLHLKPASPEAKPLRGKILLFACFRNERAFAPWFLAHYRALGVHRFYIVDNGSDDGTADFLRQQKDVHLFQSRDRYAQAGHGIRWINELLRRYGAGNWCLHVDADEQLTLPPPRGRFGWGRSPLRRLTDEMAARGEEILPAFLLDTYPQDSAGAGRFTPGDAPLEHSPLIDPDIYFSGTAACCFRRARGGARVRLFDTHEALEKAPLLRGGRGIFYQNASHWVSYGRVSRQSAVLLHHKVLRELLDLRASKPGQGAKPAPASDAGASAVQASDARITARSAHESSRHARYRASGLLDGGAIPRGQSAIALQSAVGPGISQEAAAQLASLGFFG